MVTVRKFVSQTLKFRKFEELMLQVKNCKFLISMIEICHQIDFLAESTSSIYLFDVLVEYSYHIYIVVKVDCIVTTAGGIEEDFIKCLGHTYIGDFSLKGKELRRKGINRTGNLLVPNNNYCKFEEWIIPILDRLVDEQKSQVRFLFASHVQKSCEYLK